MRILNQNFKISKPKFIIFDWDNTLVDSLELIRDSMQDTFAKFNLPPISKKEFTDHMRMCSKSFIEKYFAKDSYDEVRKVFRDTYEQLAREKITLLPKAAEALEKIREENIKMAIVSNKSRILLSMELIKLGLEEYFSSVVGSGDLEEDKPSPLPVLKALKDIGAEPSYEVWFIGDTATDMAAAHNSKCLPVFFGTDDYTSEHYRHCQPEVHFLNHEELIKYLTSLD